VGEDITERDVISAALYPAVFDDFRKHIAEYSELTADLSSSAFFHAMEEDEEVELIQAGGNAITVKFKVRRRFSFRFPQNSQSAFLRKATTAVSDFLVHFN
jgi:pyruvate carboxylase